MFVGFSFFEDVYMDVIVNGLDRFYNLPRAFRRSIVFCIDTALISIAFIAAYWMVFGELEAAFYPQHLILLLFVCSTNLFLFFKAGLYKVVSRHLNEEIFYFMAYTSLFSSLTFFCLTVISGIPTPLSIFVIFTSLSFLLCSYMRIFIRKVHNVMISKRENVLIYGAGEAGRQLASALAEDSVFKVVAFVDDDPLLQGNIIQNLTVYARSRISEFIDSYSIKKILYAIPSKGKKHLAEIVSELGDHSIEVLTVPKITDIIYRNVPIDKLHHVSIEDLLGRDPIAPKKVLMKANITGKVVMVTGAGGSIGSQLCREIIEYSPKSLVIFEISEIALYTIEKELLREIESNNLQIPIYPILGSVVDKESLLFAINRFNVTTIYHSAAYKHLPLVEQNVFEGIKNNVLGTLMAIRASAETKVENFVLISTDKAVNPSSIMGASKRLAEMILLSYAQVDKSTKYCAVRFGNVLGSSGSVVPLFRDQISRGGPVTITHEEMTRYFMTISEAAQLVIQAGAMARKGEMFILDMGNPVKIVDLAKNLILLSGLKVKDSVSGKGDIAIEIIGPREGEKIEEELTYSCDTFSTDHERIMKVVEPVLLWEEIEAIIEKIEGAIAERDSLLIREIFRERVSMGKEQRALP